MIKHVAFCISQSVLPGVDALVYIMYWFSLVDTIYKSLIFLTGLNVLTGVRVRWAPPYLVKYIKSHWCGGT